VAKPGETLGGIASSRSVVLEAHTVSLAQERGYTIRLQMSSRRAGTRALPITVPRPLLLMRMGNRRFAG
jgi:hypothetical protein